MSIDSFPKKLHGALAGKRLALDAIAPNVGALNQHLKRMRVQTGDALTGEELTTRDDWQAWNDLADDLEHEAESLCRYMRWQSGTRCAGAVK